MKKSIALLIMVGFVASALVEARYILQDQEDLLKSKEKVNTLQVKEAQAKAKRDQKLAKTNADLRYKKAKIEAEHDKDVAELETSKKIESEKMREVRYPSDYSAINNAMQTSDTRLFR